MGDPQPSSERKSTLKVGKKRFCFFRYLKNIFNMRGNPTAAKVLSQQRGACHGEQRGTGTRRSRSWSSGAWWGQCDLEDFYRGSQTGGMDSLPSFWVSCFPWGDSSGFKFLSPVPSALTSVSGPRGTSIIETDSCCLPCCLSSGWSGRLAKKKKTKKTSYLVLWRFKGISLLF